MKFVNGVTFNDIFCGCLVCTKSIFQLAVGLAGLAEECTCIQCPGFVSSYLTNWAMQEHLSGSRMCLLNLQRWWTPHSREPDVTFGTLLSVSCSMVSAAAFTVSF